jgi:hypothetical protein
MVLGMAAGLGAMEQDEGARPIVVVEDEGAGLIVVVEDKSCKNLGSVVALLLGNFEKFINLRQFLRGKNAQFCRDYKVFYSAFCH